MSVRDPSDYECSKTTVAAKQLYPMSPFMSSNFGHFDFKDGFMVNPTVPANGVFASPGIDALAAHTNGAFNTTFPGMQGVGAFVPDYASFDRLASNVTVPHEWKNPAVSAVGPGIQTELMQAKALGNLYAQSQPVNVVKSAPPKRKSKTNGKRGGVK